MDATLLIAYIRRILCIRFLIKILFNRFFGSRQAMAVFGTNEYDFRMFGTTVSVPDADIAKIMYYLDCICTVIDYHDNNIGRYRNYSNWANMSDYEDRLIYLQVTLVCMARYTLD